MKVFVFVEGPADRGALGALWEDWRARLRGERHGIKVIPLGSKSRFFSHIGPRAAEKLVNNDRDAVVGLPDLYPNAQFATTAYKHDNLQELQGVQSALVRDSLQSDYGVRPDRIDAPMTRFLPTAFRYDMETLLLAAEGRLHDYLGVQRQRPVWPNPEDVNQQRPPKHVVQALFRRGRGRAYRDTVHAPAILGKVLGVREILYGESGQVKCPVFKRTVDWMGSKTGLNWEVRP